MGYDHPALFAALLAKELKAKYKNTLLGYLWSVVTPLFQSVIFFMVFSVFLRFDIADYFLFLSIGFVVWQFFATSLTGAANSLPGNANLIRKTMAPRQIFVATAVGAELVHLLVSLPILLALALICRRGMPMNSLYVLPAAVVSVALMAYGLGLMVAVCNAKFRDLERIVQLLLQVWFYCTPIFYRAAQLPESKRFLLELNPMFYPVTLFRNCFYAPENCGRFAAIALICGGIIHLLGEVVFRRCAKDLAEVL